MSIERLGIIVGPKGRGTNLRSLANACSTGSIPARIEVVISPVGDNPASDFARSNGLKLAIAAPGEVYARHLLDALEGCTLVCLAGYLRLLPTEVLERYQVLNIHPALLPKFGGKGMYGDRVHEAVLAAGERVSGCTVHRVTPIYDEGEIIVQLECPVKEGDTVRDLADRVLGLEILAYPEAIRRFVSARIP